MLEYEYYVNLGSDILNNKTTISYGFIDSFPIMTGYIPIAIAYGVIGTQANIPSWVVLSMSIFIYAGASQFMAINLFVLNTAPIQMMIAIGVINLRHLVMGLSFFNKINLRWNIFPFLNFPFPLSVILLGSCVLQFAGDRFEN